MFFVRGSLSPPTRGSFVPYLNARGYRMLVGACNPTLCPICGSGLAILKAKIKERKVTPLTPTRWRATWVARRVRGWQNVVFLKKLEAGLGAWVGRNLELWTIC